MAEFYTIPSASCYARREASSACRFVGVKPRLQFFCCRQVPARSAYQPALSLLINDLAFIQAGNGDLRNVVNGNMPSLFDKQRKISAKP